jgi:transcriptional regulator with XRE-family HTH domain
MKDKQPSTVFASNLRQIRAALVMSQAEVARAASAALGTTLHQTTIAKIESGDRAISLDEAVAISEALRHDPWDLMGERSEQPPWAEGLEIAEQEVVEAQAMYEEHKANVARLETALYAERAAMDEYGYRLNMRRHQLSNLRLLASSEGHDDDGKHQETP